MSILFQPKAIGKMEVKNRFVRSPTGDKMATPNGKHTDTLLEFYRALAPILSDILICHEVTYRHTSNLLVANE